MTARFIGTTNQGTLPWRGGKDPHAKMPVVGGVGGKKATKISGARSNLYRKTWKREQDAGQQQVPGEEKVQDLTKVRVAAGVAANKKRQLPIGRVVTKNN